MQVESSWRKSSFSFANGNCLEASSASASVLVRDTKNHGRGPVLRFTADEWDAFIGGVRNGEFDEFGRS
jgi:Domain of unknown function (DUF397)